MSDLLAALSEAIDQHPEQAQALWEALSPSDQRQAAALALRLGRPGLTLAWTTDPLLRAAAWLRRGEVAAALNDLRGVPSSARSAVLTARALHQLAAPEAGAAAQSARRLARVEGDSGALVAAVTLVAEQELLAGTAPYAALRTLAEGLKVAELTGQPADAHLLAVLAAAQARLNPRKAAQTAGKALARSEARSPARVLALQVLGQPEEAAAQARTGELAPVWWAVMSPPPVPS
ncbi:hypothetical protein K7W42_02310 [Deinococcus sp. HMF7604]|uniref:hypothetical protein n=1 Tax=Deinococcus betulae TaxID=2873312 RepID=UPI001CCC587D|nr:hypothetical protein [Deinococcus betulae]MBZ9749691.1 hypothetical protein [Deinococcus betulae]